MKEERTSSPLLRRTGQHTATATGWPWTFLPFFILTLCWDNQCLTSGHLSFRGVRALQTDGVAARPRRRAQKVSTEESELWWQGNQRFDPDADQSAGKEEMQCDIPPYQGESRTSNNNLPYTKSVSYCTSDGQSDFSSLTDSQLDTLAQLYAPVLFFHPEEPNTMETVNATFDDPENGDIIYDGNNPQGTEDIFWPRLDLDVLLDTTRNYTLGLDKESYYFQHVLTSQYRSGAGYDPDSGRSRAPIYYNIWKNDTIAAGGYWVINYHMYYTYRGSASMGVSSTWNNRTSLRTFVLRPFGEHEGDWQTLSVAICPPPTPEVTPWSQQQLSPPLTVTFSQNEWRTTLDCTLGDCLFYKEMDATGQSEEGSIGNYHPVAFVAQRTHTMYPSSAAMMIYKEFQFNFIFRLQGIVGLDRVSYRKQLAQGQTNTTAPPYRYFLPNATNILRIRNPSEINPLTTPTMDKWMGFAGRWGGTSLFDLDFNYTLGGRYKRNANELLLRFEAARNLVERLSIFPTPPPICYDIYGSNIIPCPTKDEDPPFNNVMEMLNSFTIDAVVDSLIFGSTLAFRSVYLFFTGTGNGPRGPATQANFLAFRKAENAPLWDNSGMSVEVDGSKETRPITGAEYCQNLVTTNPFTLQSTSEPIDLYSNAIGMIVLCVLLAVGNIVAFVHPRFRGQSVPPLLFDPQTAEVSIHPKARIAILRPAIIYTVFLVVMIVGVIVYFVGYSVLVRLLNDMTDGNVGILPYAAFVIGLFVLLIDIVMAICIWIGTLETWYQVQRAYHDLRGEDDAVSVIDKKLRLLCCCAAGRGGHVLFQFFHAILFNSLIFAVLTVLIGVLNVGIASGVNIVCNRVAGAVNGICLDLSYWGVAISCGFDFNQFCHAWSNTQTVLTLWGSLIMVAGHYYLIGSVGAASTLFRDTPTGLHFLPTREVYQELLKEKSNEPIDLKDSNAVDSVDEMKSEEEYEARGGGENGNSETAKVEQSGDVDGMDVPSSSQKLAQKVSPAPKATTR